jgi:hypothetical protein
MMNRIHDAVARNSVAVWLVVMAFFLAATDMREIDKGRAGSPAGIQKNGE